MSLVAPTTGSVFPKAGAFQTERVLRACSVPQEQTMECRNLPSSHESPHDRVLMAPTAVAQFVVLWPIGPAMLGLPTLLMRYAALLAWKHIAGPTAEGQSSAPAQTVMLGVQYLEKAQTVSRNVPT